MKTLFKIFSVIISLLIFTSIYLSGCDNDKKEKVVEDNTLPLSMGGEYNETTVNCKHSYGMTFTQIGDSIMYLIFGGERSSYVGVNINTGIVTNICRDPMCSHTGSACFSSRNYGFSFKTYKNRLYMIEMVASKNANNRILSTNQYAEDAIIHYENDGNSISQIVVNDKYIFFSQRDGENIDNIYRLDLKTNEVKCMTKDNKDIYYSPLFIINDYLYFSDEMKMYRTDFDFKNIEIVKEDAANNGFQTDSEYIYYHKYIKSTENNYDGEHLLMRMNLDGTDEKIIEENAGTFFLTDKNIYFSYSMRDIEALQWGKQFDSIKGKIYKMDKDGNNVELITDIPDLFILGDYYIYGDYIYFNVANMENWKDYGGISMKPNPYRVKIGSNEVPQELIYNP